MPRGKPKSSDVKNAIKKATVKIVKTPHTNGLRYQMIAEAAYFRAESRGFVGGNTIKDWLEAEAEINNILQS
jgi:Protein of unknown function (DUF2934)